MRDDEFLYDFFSHIEVKEEEVIPKEKKKQLTSQIFSLPNTKHFYSQVEHNQFIYTQMRAFSVGWPYVAFS